MVIATEFMTQLKQQNAQLTEKEWEELLALKAQISQNPAAVHPKKMELFTQLLVRSWNAKCDLYDTTVWRTGHPMEE
jgi:galactokinase/mevalonate kinase-like predicted kinase